MILSKKLTGLGLFNFYAHGNSYEYNFKLSYHKFTPTMEGCI